MAILLTLSLITNLAIAGYLLYFSKKSLRNQESQVEYLKNIIGYKIEVEKRRKKSKGEFVPGPTLDPIDNSGSEFSPFPVLEEDN